MINAQFNTGSIISNSIEAYSLYEKSCFGERVVNRIEYSFAEALYLVSERKMQVFIGKKELELEDLIRKIKKIDKKIEMKFHVFSDLRKKGYIVKTALKFGAEFRVYGKGVKPGQEHAKWLLHTAKENEALHWHEFSAKNRIAHSTKKNLLLAIIDEEGAITYYETKWIRP